MAKPAEYGRVARLYDILDLPFEYSRFLRAYIIKLLSATVPGSQQA